jgi:hypothetical protein
MICYPAFIEGLMVRRAADSWFDKLTMTLFFVILSLSKG